MKTRHALSAALLAPLFIVIILATAGIMLNVWVYVVLAVVCPLAAYVAWSQYKEMEGKIKNTEKKGGRNRGGFFTMGKRLKKMIWLIVLSVFYVLAADTFSQESKDIHKPQQHRHEGYTKMKNPVPMTKQSVAQGKKVYEKHCQSCHGESGEGGIGPDLADAVWIHGNTDGEIFNVVTHGVEGTAMRGFEKELTKEMRWHLINYIKSLRKTEGRR